MLNKLVLVIFRLSILRNHIKNKNSWINLFYILPKKKIKIFLVKELNNDIYSHNI